MLVGTHTPGADYLRACFHELLVCGVDVFLDVGMCVNRGSVFAGRQGCLLKVRDSFLLNRGKTSVRGRISSPDTSVIGWLCFILGKFRLLCK